MIADASRARVLVDACAGTSGAGTTITARTTRLGARRLWIAFAVGSLGRIQVDSGARQALERRRVSLLPAGVMFATGDFDVGDAVELEDDAGTVFAKGIVRQDDEMVC